MDDPVAEHDDRNGAEVGGDGGGGGGGGGAEEDLEAPYKYGGLKWKLAHAQESEVAEEEETARVFFAELGGSPRECDWFRPVEGTAWGRFGIRQVFMTRSKRFAYLYAQWSYKFFQWMQFKRGHFTTSYTKRGKIEMKKAYDKLANAEDAGALEPFAQWRRIQARAGSEYGVGGQMSFPYSASLKTGSPSGGSMTREDHGPGWVELAKDRWEEYIKRSDFYDQRFLSRNPEFLETLATTENVTLEEGGLAAVNLLNESMPAGQVDNPAIAVIELSDNNSEEQEDDEEEDDNEDSSDKVAAEDGEEGMEIETAEESHRNIDLGMEDGDAGKYYMGPLVQQIPMTSTKLYQDETGLEYKTDNPELIKESLHVRWKYDKSIRHEVQKISAKLSEFQNQKNVKAAYFSGDKKQSLDHQEIGNFGETGPCRSTCGVSEWDNAHQSYGIIDCQLGSCHAMKSDRLRADSAHRQLRQHHALQHAVINPRFGGLQACGWCHYTSASPLTLFLHLVHHVCKTALLAPTYINSAYNEACGLLINGETCGKPVGDFYLAHVEVLEEITGAT